MRREPVVLGDFRGDAADLATVFAAGLLDFIFFFMGERRRGATMVGMQSSLMCDLTEQEWTV